MRLSKQSRRSSVLFTLWLLLGTTLGIHAQSVNPLAYYTDEDGNAQESTSIDDGQAPLTVRFQANPTDLGDYTPSFEWHLRKSTLEGNSKTTKEIFMRNDEDTEYTFMESGNYTITLKTTLKNGDDVMELDSASITISIAESKLEFPNAFSPNGDGVNDIYRAKPDYKSIVSFKAIILNRWGQKLYQWDDPAGGWDGTFHGNDVKQGVYFVLVEAKGADGKEYKIKKDVNLLRGYVDNENTNGNN